MFRLNEMKENISIPNNQFFHTMLPCIVIQEGLDGGGSGIHYSLKM